MLKTWYLKTIIIILIIIAFIILFVSKNYQINRVEQRNKSLKSNLVNLIPPRNILTDLLKRKDLIPYKGVLGGTMNFYDKSRIILLGEKRIYAPFDDGHIDGFLILEYSDKGNGKITWKIIDSFLEGASSKNKSP